MGGIRPLVRIIHGQRRNFDLKVEVPILQSNTLIYIDAIHFSFFYASRVP